MKSPGNPIRRNRNIGTSKQGHGQNNRFVVPDYGPNDFSYFYENLVDFSAVHRVVNRQPFTFLVEQTRTEYCHACTVEDVAWVLPLIPLSDLEGIQLIVMRQPKAKEETLGHVAWGRWASIVEIGSYAGTAIIFDAVNIHQPIGWSKSLDPPAQTELERLRRDGHAIQTTRRGHLITLTLESSRSTQLFRTLLHEVGHHVDHKTNPDAFMSKPSRDKEDFAHRYADQLRSELTRQGMIPFDRLFDPEQIQRAGLRIEDFQTT